MRSFVRVTLCLLVLEGCGAEQDGLGEAAGGAVGMSPAVGGSSGGTPQGGTSGNMVGGTGGGRAGGSGGSVAAYGGSGGPSGGGGTSASGGAGGRPPNTGGAMAAGGTAGGGMGGTAGMAGGMGGAQMPPAMAGCSVTRPGGGGNDPGGLIPVCCTPSGTNRTMVDEVFQLLNAHRMANGRSALALDPKLEAAIQGHCRHMASHPFFSHAAPEADVAAFGRRASLCGASATGENIARGQRTPAAVMSSWKSSSGHNANMLGGYTRVGIGEYQLNWGQIFGR